MKRRLKRRVHLLAPAGAAFMVRSMEIDGKMTPVIRWRE